MQSNQNTACSQWNDRCMMDDMMQTAKKLAVDYGTFICEGSTQPLRQVLTTNMDQLVQDQYQIFDQMRQRGWYQPAAAETQKIQQTRQRFTQQKNQLM